MDHPLPWVGFKTFAKALSNSKHENSMLHLNFRVSVRLAVSVTLLQLQ